MTANKKRPELWIVRGIVVLLACLATSMAMAQTPVAPAALVTPITPPDQSQAIALSSPPATARSELWENFHGEQIVRNVTAPTLTPVLPDSAKATGAAVIVAPGGGFLFLSMSNEGYPVAHWLADHGIAAFVLKYRTRETPDDPQAFLAAMATMMKDVVTATDPGASLSTLPQALEDAKAAVKLVRSRAKEWQIDPARVGFLGFSAGAMTTLGVGLTEDTSARPDFIAPIYGPLNARPAPADAPPMFVAVALDDPLMAKGKSLDLIESWRSAHRPVEAHFYEHGGHGFGMSGRRPASALWIDEFYAWMADRGLLKPK